MARYLGSIVAVLLVSCAWRANAEDASIVESRLSATVKYLAADELEGRGVGSKGLDKAAEYIASEFSKAGLQTQIMNESPFQAFEITTHAELGSKEKNSLVLIGPPGDDGKPRRTEFKLGKDFNTLAIGGTAKVTAPIVFVGYGISAPDYKYDDYQGIDVDKKVVIILRKEPQQSNEKSVFNGKNPSSHAPFVAKISNAYQHGAAAVILVNDSFGLEEEANGRREQWSSALNKLNDEREKFKSIKEPTPEDWKKHRTAVTNLASLLSKLDEQLTGDGDPLLETDGAGFTSGQRKLAVFFAKRSMIDPILKAAMGSDLAALEAKIDQTLSPVSQELSGWRSDAESDVRHVKAPAKNVLAVLPGHGSLADETVIVGAHYDHVGMGGAGSGSLAPWTTDVHNGADDNASGTAALLEVARMLNGQQNSNSRRIVFMAFTGEERGLLGSEYYIDHPVFPLEKTVAMVNMDMVGRLNENKLVVYGTGTSTGFDPLIDRLNKKYAFDLKKDPAGEGPSDHAVFYRRKIPVFHFFTGSHNDYHRPSDDVEKINVPGMRRVAEMVAEVVNHLATESDRPDYLVVKSRAVIPRTDRPRPSLGTIPDYTANVEGCRLESVRDDGPAARGGLKSGDIVTKIGEHRVGSVEDYDQVLRKFRPGDLVKITVKRDDKTMEFEVTFGQPRF